MVYTDVHDSGVVALFSIEVLRSVRDGLFGYLGAPVDLSLP